MLEGRVAAILAQLEVGLRKNFLADVLELGPVLRKAGGDAEDAALVARGELGIGTVIAGQRRIDELLIRRGALRRDHRVRVSQQKEVRAIILGRE